MEYKPIFIAGADRSGTSLLYALLASHPNISMVRRTNMWRYFYGRFGDLRNPENFERCLTTMLRYKRLHLLNPDPERIRTEFWQSEPTYGHLFALFHAHLAEERGRVRWGDKSLHTEHYVEQVFKEFPQAKIIAMVRDPRDRFTSASKRYKNRVLPVGSPTGRWLHSVRQALRNEARYPDRFMNLQYETLARHPEDSLIQVCEFIGEPYSQEMLTMGGAPRHESGNSSFGEIQPRTISTRSIGRYREALDPSEVAFIQIYSKRLMIDFDYQLDSVNFSRGKRAQFWLADFPINTVRMLRSILQTTRKLKRGETIPPNRLEEQPLKLETAAGVSS